MWSLYSTLSLASIAYASIGPIADVHLVNRVVSPDGFPRSAVLAGATNEGSLPGPLIVGKKGDELQLNVVNSLTDTTMLRETSIHWHGFFQKDTAWADGPAGVTQCPILPGNSFLYKFSTTDQAGTFWYHSHLSTQYCDGLRGAIAIYDPEDPHASMYDVDDESTVITLGDWYHNPAPSANLPTIPVPDSTLINGLGRSSTGGATALSIINVTRGKRYRFRLVNIACRPSYDFSIDKHEMTIIEVDSINVTPLKVDSITLFPGQRYSFVLYANQDIGNYWVRAKPNVGNTAFTGGINSAIFRYAGADDAEPTTTFTPSNPMLETNLHPLTNPGAPGGDKAPDTPINLLVGRDAENHFTVNGASFVPPTAPVLLQILSGKRTAQELLPEGSVYTLLPNKIIEVSIPGGGGHPFHLHGHAFDVIRSANSSVYNYKDPVRRDVVSTGGPGDNVTIRFATDNAGPWIFHCHIDWHLEIGLAIVFAEDVDTIAKQDPPPAWDQLCPSLPGGQ